MSKKHHMGSHSRRSYPSGKLLPKNAYPKRISGFVLSSTAKQVIKQMHKKKARKRPYEDPL